MKYLFQEVNLNKKKEKIEKITDEPINTDKEMKVFKDLYLHGYLNKNSNALSSKKLYKI